MDLTTEQIKDKCRLTEISRITSTYEYGTAEFDYAMKAVKSKYSKPQPVDGMSIQDLMLTKKSNEATEKVVLMILTENKIYTIRDDNGTEIWYYKDGIYLQDGISYIEERCRDLFEVCYTGHLKNKVIDKIKADTYIKNEDFFKIKDPFIIPLLNGFFNLETNKLQEYSSDYVFTNKLKVYYEEETNCEDIIKFFNEILKDPVNDILLIQEMFGYCLLKCYDYQYAFMLLGNGRNGKGVTLSLLENMLGIRNVSSLSLQQIENEKFLLHRLFNKHANIVGDLSKKALQNTGNFKKLTGQDIISADRKFKSTIDFHNVAKLIYSCNDLPFSYDDSDGFYDRWKFLDFPFKFVDKVTDSSYQKLKDPKLKDKLLTQENLNGLFKWSLIGLKRLIKNNKFSDNKTSSDNRTRWRRQSSSFNAFFDDHCTIDFQGYTTIQSLKENYQTYCRKHDLKFESNAIIKNILEQNGCDNVLKRIDFGEYQDVSRVWKGVVVTFVTM